MILVKTELKPSDVEGITSIGKTHCVTLEGGVSGSCCVYDEDGAWFLVKIYSDFEESSNDIQSLLDNEYQVSIRRV